MQRTTGPDRTGAHAAIDGGAAVAGEAARQDGGCGRPAVVIGGSMAGLLAARVLADHFERVTVVERDRFPAEPAFRKGVPQARHVHVLLTRGSRALERLFPGVTAELAAAGAPAVDWTADLAVLMRGGWHPRFPSGMVTRTCSRALLEWTIRRRVAARSNIRFLEACDVVDLLPDPSGAGVAGARLRWREAPPERLAPEEREALRADLVVDASGRDSRAPRWLGALGYPAPAETTINSFLGYATRWYRRPAGFAADWKALLLSAGPPEGKRGGVILPVEGDRWFVTLTGGGRDYPPADEADFLAFARTLRAPTLYEAILGAEPLSPVYSYRRTENRLRHYERLPRWPEGFVVVGDAVCAFNPVYGQGMTVAALAAEALDACLAAQTARGGLAGLAPRFQRQLAKVNEPAWLLATGEDFRYRETEGGRPGWTARLLHRYMDHLLLAAAQDPAVHRVFIEVIQLLQPPRALARPSIALAVLRHAARRWLALAGRGAPLAVRYRADGA